MKDCLLVGVILGMVAGALVYRYSNDVQKLADKGEKMVKEEVSKIEKANSESSKQTSK